MKSTGLICEYNPFHNGHLYHLNKAKELDKDAIIIVVLGGNFLERGNISILDKYTKAELALEYGADLVVELPFPFSTQSADIFARGSIEILKILKCQKLVFGSESNNIDMLYSMANTQLNSKEYDKLIKKYLNNGINYPTALSKALEDLNKEKITSPNDLLGLSYIREIIRQKTNIEPLTIKRTNDYHDKETQGEISSATSIRQLLNNGIDIKNFVPELTNTKLKDYKNYEYNYFKYLKYKIISEDKEIKKYQTVDEGIENRILKYINESSTLEELINNIKTKRYTYNKISRMLTHILCNFTKIDAKNNQSIKYIRVLGFNKKGQAYLNSIKKELTIPLITKLDKKSRLLTEIDNKVDSIYSLITENNYKNKLIKKENDL